MLPKRFCPGHGRGTWVELSLISMVHQFCPAPQPILPNFQLPKQDGAGRQVMECPNLSQCQPNPDLPSSAPPRRFLVVDIEFCNNLQFRRFSENIFLLPSASLSRTSSKKRPQTASRRRAGPPRTAAVRPSSRPPRASGARPKAEATGELLLNSLS